MAGFLTRTKHLDEHTAHQIRIRAKAIADAVIRDSKRDSEEYADIDSPPMYELASKFSRHEDTEVISTWLSEQDTAFRDYVPQMVSQILKDNTYQ
jgi:hypothetical protein